MSVAMPWGRIACYETENGTIDDITDKRKPAVNLNYEERLAYYKIFLFKYANSNIVATNHDGSVRWIIHGFTDFGEHQPFIGVAFVDGKIKAENWVGRVYDVDPETGQCSNEVLKLL
jgi:hypothetical protein